MTPDKKMSARESRRKMSVGRGSCVKVCRYTLEPSASSLTTLREFIRVTLKPYPHIEPHVNDIVSATHEACKNSLFHNPENECPVDVICRVFENRVVVEVTDSGNGFDPDILPPSAPDPDALEGRGLLIIYSLMDEVEAETGENGTRVMMQKRVWPDARAQG